MRPVSATSLITRKQLGLTATRIRGAPHERELRGTGSQRDSVADRSRPEDGIATRRG